MPPSPVNEFILFDIQSVLKPSETEACQLRHTCGDPIFWSRFEGWRHCTWVWHVLSHHKETKGRVLWTTARGDGKLSGGSGQLYVFLKSSSQGLTVGIAFSAQHSFLNGGICHLCLCSLDLVNFVMCVKSHPTQTTHPPLELFVCYLLRTHEDFSPVIRKQSDISRHLATKSWLFFCLGSLMSIESRQITTEMDTTWNTQVYCAHRTRWEMLIETNTTRFSWLYTNSPHTNTKNWNMVIFKLKDAKRDEKQKSCICVNSHWTTKRNDDKVHICCERAFAFWLSDNALTFSTRLVTWNPNASLKAYLVQWKSGRYLPADLGENLSRCAAHTASSRYPSSRSYPGCAATRLTTCKTRKQ